MQRGLGVCPAPAAAAQGWTQLEGSLVRRRGPGSTRETHSWMDRRSFLQAPLQLSDRLLVWMQRHQLIERPYAARLVLSVINCSHH